MQPDPFDAVLDARSEARYTDDPSAEPDTGEVKDTLASGTGHDTARPRRLLSCIEEWPDCESGEYHPRCCRFPKSCSCRSYSANTPESELEPVAVPGPVGWECDGSNECAAPVHLHGCYSDDGTNCDHPSEHAHAAPGPASVSPAEKLVRDIFEYLPHRVAEPGERWGLLSAKFDEEVTEVKAAVIGSPEFIEELADLVEVCYALGGAEKVEAARLSKLAERGGFEKLLVMRLADRTDK